MSGLANAYDLRDEKQAKEYLDKLGIEYRYQCYHEKLSDGCHRLADYLEAFKKDYVKARTVYQQNCTDNNYAHSCFKIGNYNFLGKGGEKMPVEAYNYYLKGCHLGNSGACFNAAIMNSHDSDKLGPKNLEKVVELLEKGCSLGCTKSCYKLTSIYLDKQEYKKAFEVALNNCSRDHMESCVNVSIMYKKGEGVAKSQELALKFQEKAKNLFKQREEQHRTLTFGQ